MEHKLVKSEFQAGNKEGLQYYVECSCGFQGRLGTKEAAESQLNNHLMVNNAQPSVNVTSGVKVEEAKQEAPKGGLTKLGGGWKPFGAK